MSDNQRGRLGTGTALLIIAGGAALLFFLALYLLASVTGFY